MTKNDRDFYIKCLDSLINHQWQMIQTYIALQRRLEIQNIDQNMEKPKNGAQPRPNA